MIFLNLKFFLECTLLAWHRAPSPASRSESYSCDSKVEAGGGRWRRMVCRKIVRLLRTGFSKMNTLLGLRTDECGRGVKGQR